MTRAIGSLGFLPVLLLWCLSCAVLAQGDPDAANVQQFEEEIAQLEEPLYNPFVERYVLDELKQLRVEQAQTKNELLQQIFDREHNSVDRAVAYATDTVTYFFYLIAAATSVLVLVGWSSIRDIKERVHTAADEEVSKLVSEYERRLEFIESQLQQKTQHIEENREEIELTQEIQGLWLRAQQESSPGTRIRIYDQILKLRKDDSEALTFKADAVLELHEPQWAINLCLEVLNLDPGNAHALYQMACANAMLGRNDEAIAYLKRAIEQNESYAADAARDPAFEPLRGLDDFQTLDDETNK
jgi:tetratricopeptide (TPR) repeat protein